MSAAHQCSSARRLGASGRGYCSIGGGLSSIGGRRGSVGGRLGCSGGRLGGIGGRLGGVGGGPIGGAWAGACGSARARASWGARPGVPRGARAGACGSARAGAAGGAKPGAARGARTRAARCQRRRACTEWEPPSCQSTQQLDESDRAFKRPGLRAPELSAAGMQPPLTGNLACSGWHLSATLREPAGRLPETHAGASNTCAAGTSHRSPSADAPSSCKCAIVKPALSANHDYAYGD